MVLKIAYNCQNIRSYSFMILDILGNINMILHVSSWTFMIHSKIFKTYIYIHLQTSTLILFFDEHQPYPNSIFWYFLCLSCHAFSHPTCLLEISWHPSLLELLCVKAQVEATSESFWQFQLHSTSKNVKEFLRRYMLENIWKYLKMVVQNTVACGGMSCQIAHPTSPYEKLEKQKGWHLHQHWPPMLA